MLTCKIWSWDETGPRMKFFLGWTHRCQKNSDEISSQDKKKGVLNMLSNFITSENNESCKKYIYKTFLEQIKPEKNQDEHSK